MVVWRDGHATGIKNPHWDTLLAGALKPLPHALAERPTTSRFPLVGYSTVPHPIPEAVGDETNGTSIKSF